MLPITLDQQAHKLDALDNQLKKILSEETLATSLIEKSIDIAHKYNDLTDWECWLSDNLAEVRRKIESLCPNCEGEGCRNCDHGFICE